jgi:hypothetical protein
LVLVFLPIVLAHEENVHAGEERLFVHAQIPSKEVHPVI